MVKFCRSWLRNGLLDALPLLASDLLCCDVFCRYIHLFCCRPTTTIVYNASKSPGFCIHYCTRGNSCSQAQQSVFRLLSRMVLKCTCLFLNGVLLLLAFGSFVVHVLHVCMQWLLQCTLLLFCSGAKRPYHKLSKLWHRKICIMCGY